MTQITLERFTAGMGEDGALASMRFLTLTDDEQKAALDKAVSIINSRHAPRPVSAGDIHIHAATMSTDQLDSYFSRMHGSSLMNFAAQAGEGRAFLRSHLTRELPLGHTFEGEYKDDGNSRSARAGIYMLRGSNLSGTSTDEMSKAIDAGTVRDVSVGFSGGKSVCDVCGNDLRDYENCPHIPGTKYKTPGGGVATYSIHDAGLRELSGVYEGATPGAMFSRQALDKTERGIVSGFIQGRDIVLLEERYHLPLTTDRKFISVPNPPVDNRNSTDKTTQERMTDTMKAKQLLDHIIVRSGAHLPEEVRQALEGVRGSLTDESTDLAPVLAPLERALAAAHETQDKLAELRAAGIADLPAAQRLVTEAKDGRQYRENLIRETLAEGVRAYGNDFAKETYERMLKEPSRSLEDILNLRKTWEKQTRDKLGQLDDEGNPTGSGGRATVPLHGFEEMAQETGTKRTKAPSNTVGFRPRR